MHLTPNRVAWLSILLAAALFLFLTASGRASIFVTFTRSSDTTAVALYLLSTLVQGLAAIFAITIAVLFLAAQIYSRPQYTRAVAELYRDTLTWVVVSVFFIALAMGIVSLSRLRFIVENGQLFVLDWNIILGLTALA